GRAQSRRPSQEGGSAAQAGDLRPHPQEGRLGREVSQGFPPGWETDNACRLGFQAILPSFRATPPSGLWKIALAAAGAAAGTALSQTVVFFACRSSLTFRPVRSGNARPREEKR